MKWLAGGLTLVNVSVVSGVALGILLGGLVGSSALFALLLGAASGWLAFAGTIDPGAVQPVDGENARAGRARGVWFWLVALCFGFFAFRAFCWLIYIEGNSLRIQSPNNLGDLAIHITYIRYLASGIDFWPENPLFFIGQLRYPAGVDLFNSLLLLTGVDLIQGLIWAGLLGALAAFVALYRWGGVFGVAGFLFNGGLAGFQILELWEFLDYQGDRSIAWKSLPLAMLVTQRGLLYALPAGLLLLQQWRARFLAGKNGTPRDALPLPFWVELAFYATLPFFHLHTFMALSIVAAWLFFISDRAARREFGLLAGLAFLPATLLVGMITDRFRAGSLLSWHPGWVQGVDEFTKGFVPFWFVNFGFFIPAVLLLLGFCIWRAWGKTFRWREQPALAFLVPAALIFAFAFFIKTAPWGWDNIKLLIWAYLIVLPFLWRDLIAHWPAQVRAAACFLLFASGFISLVGGLTHQREGHSFAERSELDAVGVAVRKLPVDARFATYPTYNHPVLLHGRKVALGYPGHLWTQGVEYQPAFDQLSQLMQGAPDWREKARALRVRYLFWGREEKANYGENHPRPWEKEAALVTRGAWGAIYDLERRSGLPFEG